MPDHKGLSPLFFDPLFKEKVWGGNGLKKSLGKNIPDNVPIGESWEISGVPGDESVCRTGEFAGKSLSEILFQEKSRLVGDSLESGEFPLLYKFIDAHDKLSVQVHPNDEQARSKKAGNFGKTECWYIVDAKPGAQLICGLAKGVGFSEVKNALYGGRLDEICNYVSVRPGDVVFVPAGTVHATFENILLYEVQQTSDTTYRLYDWKRLDSSGKSRPLHIDEALDVLDLTVNEHHKIEPLALSPIPQVNHLLRLACRYFALEEFQVDSNAEFPLAPKKSFRVMTSLNGPISLISAHGAATLHHGESVLIPAATASLRCSGAAGAHFLLSYVPDLSGEIIAPLRSLKYSDDRIVRMAGNPSKNDLQSLV
jgi:mannose-6-phosphate isomerase